MRAFPETDTSKCDVVSGRNWKFVPFLVPRGSLTEQVHSQADKPLGRNLNQCSGKFDDTTLHLRQRVQQHTKTDALNSFSSSK